MNKRQKKKFMNRRYEVIEGEFFSTHSFKAGEIIVWTGEEYHDGRVKLFARHDGLRQYIPSKDLKRSYKKFQ